MALAKQKCVSFTLGQVLMAYLKAWFLTWWPEIPSRQPLKSENNTFQDSRPIIDCMSLRTAFPQGLSDLFQELQVCLMIAHAYRFLSSVSKIEIITPPSSTGRRMFSTQHQSARVVSPMMEEIMP